MLLRNRILKIIISLEFLVISSMMPVTIPVPLFKNLNHIIEIPINWQIPIVIALTLLFSGELLIKALSIYLFIGLFLFPVFFDGGSLGYLLTPNFGYLLGLFPLIKIINILNKKKDLLFPEYLKYPIIGLTMMHLTGILYSCFLLLLFNKLNLIFFYIGKYSLSKVSFHILIIFPTLIVVKFMKRFKVIIQ